MSDASKPLCPTCHFPIHQMDLQICIVNLVGLLNREIKGEIEVENVSRTQKFTFLPSEMIDGKEHWWEFEAGDGTTGSVMLKMVRIKEDG